MNLRDIIDFIHFVYGKIIKLRHLVEVNKNTEIRGCTYD